MKKTIKALLLVFLTTFLVAGGYDVKADESSQLGTIIIHSTYDKKAVVGGNMTVYQVAILSDNLTFQLLSPFDATSLSLTTENMAEHNRDYAQTLAKYTSGTTAVTTVESISAEGMTVSNLQPGLYLFVQTVAADGYETLQPFLVSIPQNGSYTIEATEKMSPVTVKPKTVVPDKNQKRDKTLPFTGQLWWPVPLLIGAGILCLGLSFIARRPT
ncbi:hypothetical protein ACVR05_08515 [Streptococcus caprae]|uniref:Uncharacterized protein n=1 Tax=Streptococcus caprae TaxID=1640501 RepID=A0ABV8CUT6_9STRE